MASLPVDFRLFQFRSSTPGVWQKGTSFRTRIATCFLLYRNAPRSSVSLFTLAHLSSHLSTDLPALSYSFAPFCAQKWRTFHPREGSRSRDFRYTRRFSANVAHSPSTVSFESRDDSSLFSVPIVFAVNGRSSRSIGGTSNARR